jgi:hypothetical protein
VKSLHKCVIVHVLEKLSICTNNVRFYTQGDVTIHKMTYLADFSWIGQIVHRLLQIPF